jgi:hypothetical protein
MAAFRTAPGLRTWSPMSLCAALRPAGRDASRHATRPSTGWLLPETAGLARLSSNEELSHAPRLTARLSVPGAGATVAGPAGRP